MRVAFGVLLFATVARADPSLWDAPKRHSFVFKNISLELILEEIANRFDRRIGLHAPADEAMAWRARNVTWFEALDDLARAAELDITGVPDKENPVRLVPGKRGKRFVAHAGGTRLSLERVTLVRSAAFGAEEPEDDEKNRIALRFKWIADKGLESAAITDLRLDKAVDDKRTPLGWKRGWEFPCMANRMFTIRIEAGPKRTRSLKKLAGAFRVAIPVATKTIEFSTDDTETTKKLGGCEVTFHEVLYDPDRISFTVKGFPCAEFKEHGRKRTGARVTTHTRSSWRHTTGIGDISVLLYNAKGKPVGAGRTSYVWKEKEKSWSYRLEAFRSPHRIVMRAVTAVAVREIPFAFSDIPLP